MIKKWRTLKDEVRFTGGIFRYRQVERESTTQVMRGHFDVLDFAHWVNIVALTKNGEVICVKQYRQGVDDVTIEIPGGAVHRGEDPILAAKRELEEETGHIATEWIALNEMMPNPAIQGNRCYVFLAIDCMKVGELKLDPLEELEVELIKKKEFLQMIDQGVIAHSLTIASSFYARKYLS